MEQTRREFLKTTALSGAVILLSRYDLWGSEAYAGQAIKAADWQAGPGKARFRIDGFAKVTGQKIYARDFRARDLPGWPQEEQVVYILRATFSDHVFEGIDLSELPEELKPQKIVTQEDLQRDGIHIAETNYPEGMYLVPKGSAPDHLGQPVALLFFKDLQTMKAARSQLMFELDPIKKGAAITLPKDYVYQPETSIIHIVKEGPEPYEKRVKFAQTKGGPVHPEEPGKRNAEAMLGVELIDGKLKSGNWTLTQGTYTTQLIDPMFMEPESGLGWLDQKQKTLHLLIGTQSPQDDANTAAELFKDLEGRFKVETIDFTSCYLGGGFGGRDTSIFCVYLSLAAAYAEGPVRIIYDRFEQFQSGIKRHPATMDMTLATDDKGQFQALRTHAVLNGGGRPNLSKYVAQVAGLNATGPYDFPLADILSQAVHTRSAGAGSMRGYGASMLAFAIESSVDEAARSLKMDAIDLRQRNVLHPGWAISTGAPKAPPGLEEMCKKARGHRLWSHREQLKKTESKGDIAFGVGFAITMKNYGTGADAIFNDVAIDPSGQITVTTHAVDMGNGSATTLALSTAAILGANATSIKLGEIDLFKQLDMVESFEPQPDNPRWTPLLFMSSKAATTSSRWVHSVEQSSHVLFETGLFPAAQSLWGKKGDILKIASVHWHDGHLIAPGLRPLSLKEIAAKAHADQRITAVMNHAFFSAKWVEGDYSIDGVTQRRPLDGLAIRRGQATHYEIVERKNPALMTVESIWEGNGQTFGASACLVAVTVNRKTGEVKVVEGVHYLAPGKVLQQEMVEGQMDGAFAMGVGHALLEDLPAFEDGPTTGHWNLDRYHVALAGDSAIGKIEKVILPPESTSAPARGIAEVVLNPVAPAIANAVTHAIEVRFRDLPITAEKVRNALDIKRS
ncbi:MAG: xanthine dehydrogenase family protein molybdopterin-binding subunit [Gammaproteobacteria bacterium]|nr:xanthine dehydrogenase family protein molybdopterin-binding subunit [Gammaproteobacteria bacterium]NBY21823.1 xanthine dehydrogenase family protein molybdopterin-binding subunit [Gammaproteobacteria bacterium]NDE33554.1 xanthine dehydrogenase family protein molybdopterin-binding subunit [Gammaproteobacteria bacterium]NDE56059.1 xanthine dehydrogenase family protein molybdopterin-binding subunit [Gammaproteobacteria bacterium]NDG87840.1 xanthine dehydrogenase family protein molybdopterin-bind